MKIYTKKGDSGMTSLFGGGSYPKDAIRIESYGTIDELNSVVGCAVGEAGEEKIKNRLLEIQKQLFVLGAELATLKPTPEMEKGFIQGSHIEALEKDIDTWETGLKPLKQFILPGGSHLSSYLHLARGVCRRAERKVVSLKQNDPIRPEVIQFLNRLSDWLFVLARHSNHRAKVEDILWEGILKG